MEFRNSIIPCLSSRLAKFILNVRPNLISLAYLQLLHINGFARLDRFQD